VIVPRSLLTPDDVAPAVAWLLRLGRAHTPGRRLALMPDRLRRHPEELDAGSQAPVDRSDHRADARSHE
jgi:hypothetical protein